MPRLIKRVSKKTGLAPGTLVHVGEKKIEQVRLRLIDYDAANFQEKEIEAIEEAFPFKDAPTVTWINIDGLHEVDVIARIGKHFNLHPLILEDIVNTGQRPKMEDFEDYLFAVLKMLHYDQENDRIEAEQISLVVGPNFLLSFQERPGDVFNGVRERLRKAKGRIRKAGTDYLAYALIDAVVDEYYMILEIFGEMIEVMEEEILADPAAQTVQNIHDMKREMIFLRKQVWPVRELVSGLSKGESSLIQESTGIYLRDVYDHTIQIIDTIESFRDMLSGMLDIYLSTLSNKMNEVMKVLTIIATIFIPLTFVAGIYGMNFKYMPELEWRLGYPIVWGVMIVIVGSLVFYFKRKRWL
jgi:magnesium transporter